MGLGEKRQQAKADALVDEAAKESFPASDPPVFTDAVSGAPATKDAEEKPPARRRAPRKKV